MQQRGFYKTLFQVIVLSVIELLHPSLRVKQDQLIILSDTHKCGAVIHQTAPLFVLLFILLHNCNNQTDNCNGTDNSKSLLHLSVLLSLKNEFCDITEQICKRSYKEHTVKTVKHTAVTGQQLSVIFYTAYSFD